MILKVFFIVKDPAAYNPEDLSRYDRSRLSGVM